MVYGQMNFVRVSFALEPDKQLMIRKKKKCEAESKHELIDTGTRFSGIICN